MDHQVEGVDLISSLPDGILHRILSFVDSPQDLVFTSILSKRWFDIWCSSPVFKFSQCQTADILHQREVAKFGGHPQDLMAVGGEILMSSADRRLQRFRGQNHSVSSFTLQMWPSEGQIPLLDEWVQILVEKNARDIYLDLNRHFLQKMYTLPNMILSSTSLTSLTLDSCSLPANFMCHDVPINSLKTLSLRKVELSAKAMEHLTDVFPSMKELFLCNCLCHTEIILPLLAKLEKVELLWVPAVLIHLDAPELQHLSYASCEENVVFNLLSCISKLTTLRVRCAVLQTSAFCQLVSCCTVLEELDLHVSTLGDKFILTSLSLKKLRLGRYLDIQDITIDAPNLEYFRYDGEPTATTFVFTSQTVKCDAHVSLLWCPEIAVAPWLIRLYEFLRRTVKFKALHITFGEHEVDVDALTWLMHCQSKITPFELHEMVISYDPDDLNCRQLFAAVFCCCKPLSLTIEPIHGFSVVGEKGELFSYIYEQLQHEEDEDWERKVHILARNKSHHNQRFATLDDFIDEFSALRLGEEVSFKTQRVKRVKM